MVGQCIDGERRGRRDPEKHGPGADVAGVVETENEILRASTLAMTEGRKAKPNSTDDGSPFQR